MNKRVSVRVHEEGREKARMNGGREEGRGERKGMEIR